MESVIPTERTNDEWCAALATPGVAQDAALRDLRVLIVRGLRRGLVGWVDTRKPEFDALAEDFAQEALLKVLDKLDTFQGKSRFTTWANKIAVRIALTELRRKRWKNVSLEHIYDDDDTPATETLQAAADPGAGPELRTTQADLVARVRRIIDEELTPKQRTAMTSVAIQGLPADIVADRMDMTRNALYKLLFDARTRLKKRLAAEGLTPDDVLGLFE